MIAVYIICLIPMPFIIIGAGWLLKKYPPTSINKSYGYRTKRSMSSIDAWNFAQENCGRIWIKTGKLILIPSVIMCILCCFVRRNTAVIILTVFPIFQIAAMLISIIPMEKQLKEKFCEKQKGDFK